MRQNELLEENNKLMRQLLSEMQFQKKEWLSPDEVCDMLGIDHTKSGSHRRRLKALRERGLLSIFGQEKPYTYSHDQVRRLAEKVHKGKMII